MSRLTIQWHTAADPATKIEFPTTLVIPSKSSLPKFSLVGLGVRTVSFLGVKVYSIALYADLNNPNLQVSAFVWTLIFQLFNGF